MLLELISKGLIAYCSSADWQITDLVDPKQDIKLQQHFIISCHLQGLIATLCLSGEPMGLLLPMMGSKMLVLRHHSGL